MDAFSLDDYKKKNLTQPNNSLGEPVQGVIDANQQQNYILAPWANQQQPQQQEESGYFDAALRGAKAQAAGALGGQADFVSGVLGTDGEVGNALQGVMQNNRRKKDYTFDDITNSFGSFWNYVKDPEGLAYDVGGGFGSSGVLGMEGLAIATALPASVTAGIGTGISAAAARVGIPWLGKVMNTPAGKALIGNVLKTPLEGISEGGNVYREMTHDEYGNPIANADKEAARKAMYSDAAMNSALLTFTNSLESMGLGSLIAGAGGKNVFMRTMKGALGDFVQNGFEEGAQQGISQYSQGKGTLGQILNPAQWSDEQKTEALIGGITGLGQGAVMTAGGTAVNRMFGNQQPNEVEQPENVTPQPIAQEQAETTQQTGTNDLVDRVRALEGQIPFYADDGTNCMRTMGIALAGTPYEGQINVDQAIATATELGQLMDPETYTPRPGDLAVTEDGGHIVMITENGGTIQNGASRNGVYESDASAAEMSSDGKVKYYIRTSDYSNGGENIVSPLGTNTEETDIVDDFLNNAEENQNPFDVAEEQKQQTEETQNNQVAEEQEQTAQPDIVDAILDRMQGKQIGIPGVAEMPSIRKTPASVRSGKTVIKSPPESKYVSQDSKNFLSKVGQLRSEHAAKKQQALDTEWLMMEHEKNTKGFSNIDEIRNNPSPNVIQAAQSRAMQEVTQRAMLGDHSAQRTFARMGADVRAYLLQREMDRLNAENAQANNQITPEGVKTEGWLSDIYDRLDDKYGGNVFQEIKRRAAEKRARQDGSQNFALNNPKKELGKAKLTRSSDSYNRGFIDSIWYVAINKDGEKATYNIVYDTNEKMRISPYYLHVSSPAIKGPVTHNFNTREEAENFIAKNSEEYANEKHKTEENNNENTKPEQTQGNQGQASQGEENETPVNAGDTQTQEKPQGETQDANDNGKPDVPYEFQDLPKYNAVGIKFEGIPNEAIRARMKAAKMRWNPKDKLWWAKKDNQDAMGLLKEWGYQSTDTEETQAPEVKPETAKGETQETTVGTEETTTQTTETTQEDNTIDWGENPDEGLGDVFGAPKKPASGGNRTNKPTTSNSNTGGKKTAEEEKAERRRRKAQALADALKGMGKNQPKLQFNVGASKATFNANIFTVGCNLGYDMLEDYDNYGEWKQAMIDQVAEAAGEDVARQLEPFLGMLYKGVTSFPEGFNLDVNKLSKLAPAVGSRYAKGIRSLNAMVQDFKDSYGDEVVDANMDYIKAAFEGVKEAYENTLDEVQEEKPEPTDGEKPQGTGVIIQTTEEERQRDRDKRKKDRAASSSHILALNTLIQLFEQSGIKVVTDLEELIEACRKDGMQLVNADEAVEKNDPLIVRNFAGIGELYGMMDPRTGTMYLDPNCDLDTPIHEYTHLWNKTVKETNPELWKRGVELAQQTPLWEKIKNDPFYSVSTRGDDDRIADEVLARICGPEGERILQEMSIGEKTPEGLVKKLRNWVKQFWQLIKKTFTKWGNDDVADMTIEDFAKMPMRALLEGVDVLKLRQASEAGMYDNTDDGPTKAEAVAEAEKNKPKGDDEDDSGTSDGDSGQNSGSGQTDNTNGTNDGKPGTDGIGGQGSGTTDGTRGGHSGSDGVSGSGTPGSGEKTVPQGENGSTGTDETSSGSSDDLGSDNPGFQGEPTVDEGELTRTLEAADKGQVDEAPEGLTQEEKDYRAGLPDDEKGIFDKVVKKMPFLSLLQKGNVAAWLKRTVVDGKTSLLLTDGTGTGKTYSGLAMAKDVLSRKDARVLVVTPSQSICGQWIKAAQNQQHFDIQNSAIFDDTNDAGKEFTGKKGGLYTTTYANFQSNMAIFDKEWDLVIVDEGHHLSSANNGNSTGSLKNLRALTFHKRGLEERADILYATPEEKAARKAYMTAQNAAINFYNKLSSLESKHQKYGDYPATADFYAHCVFVEEAGAVMPPNDYIHGSGDEKQQDIQGFYSWLNEQVSSGKINSKEKQKLLNKYKPLFNGEENKRANDELSGGVLFDQIKALYDVYEPLRLATKDIKAKHIAEWNGMEDSKKPKVLFLSATPFAYHYNTDYAEGYLFDYPDKGDAFSPRDKFLHETFGYELDRQGRVTGKIAPDVDTSEKEVAFHELLRANGALRGESLNIPVDYNRGFIIAGSQAQEGSDIRSEGTAVGKVIDDAFKALEGKGMVNGKEDYLYPDLNNCIVMNFGGDKMADLLEALKAQEAIRYAREYVKQGKKVAIIHRRKKPEPIKSPFELPKAWKGGIFTKTPKDQKDALIQRIKTQYERFLEDHPLYRPIEYVKSLPDAKEIGLSKTPTVPYKLYVVQKGKTNEQYICRFDKQQSTWTWEKQTEDYVTNNIGTLFSGLKTALATMQDTFEKGEALYFNGSGTDKEKAKVLDAFNDDNSKQDIFVGQIDACVEGLNLHDTTGKKPRVLINITIPTKPSEFVQVEGRIYRFGTATNAMFRYITTGTNMETQMWVKRVAGKVATSENLAMGARARGLLNSIRDAFMETVESDVWKSHLPGAEGEDTGGKALDYRSKGGNEYEAAITDYGLSEKYSKNQPDGGYYATPEPIGYKMVQWAGIKDGDKVLEPSAGHGAISRYFPVKNTRVILETDPKLATVAQFYTPDSTYIPGDFEHYSSNIKFDNIVMTPPVNGTTGIEHVVKAYHQLRNGGRLVAMINDTPEQRQMLNDWLKGEGDKHFVQFKDWYKTGSSQNAYIRQAISMPSSIFERSNGSKVNPLVVIIDRFDSSKRLDNTPVTLDDVGAIGTPYRSSKSIEEIFETFKDQFDGQIPARFSIDNPHDKAAKKAKEWFARKYAPLAEKYGTWYKPRWVPKMFKASEEFIGVVDGFNGQHREYIGKAKDDPIGRLLSYANNQLQEPVGYSTYNSKGKLCFYLHDKFVDDEIEVAKAKLLVGAQKYLKNYYIEWVKKEFQQDTERKFNAAIAREREKAKKAGKTLDEGDARVIINKVDDSHITLEPLMPFDDYAIIDSIVDYANEGRNIVAKHLGKGKIEVSWINPSEIYMFETMLGRIARTYAGRIGINDRREILRKVKEKVNDISEKEFGKLPDYSIEGLAPAQFERASVTTKEVNRAYDEVLSEAKQAFPNAKFEKTDNGMIATLANGAKVQISIKDNIILNANQQNKALQSHGLTAGRVQGYWKKFTANGVDRMLAVSTKSELGTAFHEAMHAAIDLALTEKERQALYNYYNKLAEKQGRDVEEVVADAYRDWVLARQKGQGTTFGKLWRKIKDFCTKVKALFNKGAKVQSIFQDVENGSVYKRSGERHGLADRIKFDSATIKTARENLKDDIAKWEKSIDDFFSGKLNPRATINVMQTPLVMQYVGAKDLPIKIDYRIIAKVLKKKHGSDISEDIFKQLPGALANPMFIFKSPDKNGHSVMTSLLSLRDSNKDYIVVPVILEETEDGVNYNISKIESVYGKDAFRKENALWPSNVLGDSANPSANLLYIDKKRIDTWSKSNGLQLPKGLDYSSNSFPSSIATDDDLVNLKEEYPTQYSVATADGISFTTDKSLLGIEEAGGVKPWFKAQWKKLYTDWFDKNHALHDLDKAFEMGLGRTLSEDEKVYNKAQTLPANASGMATALIEGGDAHIRAINDRLGLKGDKALSLVTLKKVLNTIDATKMSKAYPDFLANSGTKNWVDALSKYLGYERLLEMAELNRKARLEAQQQIARLQAELAQEKEEKRRNAIKKQIAELRGTANLKEYKLPGGLTEKDLKSYVNSVPSEFKKAATQYYLINDNLLKLMEYSGLIDAETHELLKTKYKKYCPLIRDFTDTAAADSVIESLTNGGRGIGNVSSMLKRISIDGSDRTITSPIESTVKAIAVCMNRCERNRVGQMAVEMATKSNLDEIIKAVPGGKADAKNCVFTVMYNGRKQAYKTTQDLYSPIVGYNIPASGFVLGLAKNCASLLRTGATTSPSFVLRNVLRDTVFAGLSSDNGFIPMYDTVRGAWALWKNPQMRAEFEAGGVTGFNQYGSKASNYNDLVRLNGGKIDWHKPSAIWEALKLVGGKIEAVSAFAESSTRMGEYLRAREKGKSIDEAVRAAREITLDFSRSGVVGQSVNQYIPFFNACLQGGDKMARLFKEDPVGTATKLAKYIILPSVLLWVCNHDEDWYKELDPGIKNSCWCLPGGIRIPKPQEAGVTFGSGIEAMLDLAFNKDPKAIGNWASEVRSTMAPNLVPTIFLPLLEWQANYSFFRHGALVPRRLQNQPDELQYTNHTATLSKGIGHVTGLSPIKIDNTVRGYTGTMGMFLWQLGDVLEDKNMPDKKLSERQFVRDFVVNQNHRGRYLNDFYELLDAANKQHSGYGKKGEPTTDVKGIRQYGTIISGLNKDVQKITASKVLSPERKRQLIDNKKQRINQVAKKAVEKYGNKFV